MNNDDMSKLNDEFARVLPKLRKALLEVDPKMSELDIEYIKSFALGLIKRTHEKSSDTKIAMARQFLKDAKDAQKLSIITYKKGMLADSVFSLQQSVEKASKSLGLALGTLEIETLRNVGHVSPRAFIELLKEPMATQLLPYLKKFGAKQDRENIKKAEKLLVTNVSDFVSFNTEQLHLLLSLVAKIRENVVPQYQKEQNKIVTIFNKYFPEIVGNSFYDMSDFMVALTSFWVVGIITFAHEQSSRYSDTQNIKRGDYTANLPLIKFVPQMQDINKDALKYFSDYVESLK